MALNRWDRPQPSGRMHPQQKPTKAGIRTMRFHARPNEDPPRLGEFLKSEKGRNAYLVVDIKPGRSGLAGVKVFNLRLERRLAVNMPADADVFPIQWFARKKRRKSQ